MQRNELLANYYSFDEMMRGLDHHTSHVTAYHNHRLYERMKGIANNGGFRRGELLFWTPNLIGSSHRGGCSLYDLLEREALHINLESRPEDKIGYYFQLLKGRTPKATDEDYVLADSMTGFRDMTSKCTTEEGKAVLKDRKPKGRKIKSPQQNYIGLQRTRY